MTSDQALGMANEAFTLILRKEGAQRFATDIVFRVEHDSVEEYKEYVKNVVEERLAEFPQFTKDDFETVEYDCDPVIK